MKIEHIAIWATDLERLKNFYVGYFQAVAGEKYINEKKNFQSYFLSFENGCRLELMSKPEIPNSLNDVITQFTGIIHFAISIGSKEEVDRLTALIRSDGHRVVGEPRT